MISPRVADAVAEARVHLAAAHRLAVLHELEEGIDNHFTMTVPGSDDRYLILPFGLHWSEARASDLIVFDEAGARPRGRGRRSSSRRNASTRRSTASPARASSCTPTRPGRWRSTCCRTTGCCRRARRRRSSTARSPTTTTTPAWPRRSRRASAWPRLIGDKPIVFMKNHGVLVTGETVAQAYRRLYRLERVCRNQVLALSTGRPLQILSDEIVARVQTPNPDDRHPRGERERLFFEAMMRVLDRELPGYRD